jgi:uncharacterized delta-60 repeat protein
MHVQNDGKILVAGTAITFEGADYTTGAGVVFRLLPDGTLDHTYAYNGFNLVDPFSNWSDESFTHAVFADDGSIFLAGVAELNSSPSDHFIVSRVEPSGDVDTTFGDHAGFSLFAYEDSIYADWMPTHDLLLLQDGRILQFASYQSSSTSVIASMILCWDPTGHLDPHFGNGGIFRYDAPYGAESSSLAVQSDGKVLFTVSTNDPDGGAVGILCGRLTMHGSVGMGSVMPPNYQQTLPLSAYPNPAHDQVHVSYSAMGNGPVSISLRDAQGRTCKTWPVSHGGITGERTEVLALPRSISPGLYFFEVQGTDDRQVVKLQVE